MFAFIKMEPRYPWHPKMGQKLQGEAVELAVYHMDLGVWSPGFDVTRCDYKQVI